jgi:hypothetical protein
MVDEEVLPEWIKLLANLLIEFCLTQNRQQSSWNRLGVSGKTIYALSVFGILWTSN